MTKQIMAQQKPLYKVIFIQAGKQYEVFVRELLSSNIFGFIEIGDFVWDTRATIVLDPSHEKLKDEFDAVDRTFLPMHCILRVDRVAQHQIEKSGMAKIVELGDKVAHFPGPVYTPKK
ncbi:hypothetical protein VA7868_02456 [Vibrio aerogenes CECT 7868]|uniref:DUF1820 domain-containing protein n=1 Tax=Vibrio aerogenes CECT 7868 TaxID=1216006 RepID=A0A1M5Z959_9VIBR|nr:DUF1820 family protein [Vibrio aerogenes]SHI20786.1 hypothetical protein VA7868_02456 [Vibrio aerogenes CECT 7868]